MSIFTSESTGKARVALAIMCKDEAKRIHVTLNSVLPIMKALVVYDTGSTDNTVQIIRDFAKVHDIPLYLKEGTFEDFSTSRNILLDLACTVKDVDYALLMDSNDELRGWEPLQEYCDKNLSSPLEAFYLRQHWWSGTGNVYLNIRLLKLPTIWRYRGVVHEHLVYPIQGQKCGQAPECIVIYQDRTQDEGKSLKRFTRDRELLEKEVARDPTNGRNVFYLGQTYSCLGEFEKSFDMYTRRTHITEGFHEERFHAYLRSGEIAQKKMGRPWHECMTLYLAAYQCIERVEPLIMISLYYIALKQWRIAFIYLRIAIDLPIPTNCALFIDNDMYNYTRWNLMGLTAWFCQHYDIGEKCVQLAIHARPDSESDKQNMEYYLKRKQELAEKKNG